MESVLAVVPAVLVFVGLGIRISLIAGRARSEARRLSDWEPMEFGIDVMVCLTCLERLVKDGQLPGGKPLDNLLGGIMTIAVVPLILLITRMLRQSRSGAPVAVEDGTITT